MDFSFASTAFQNVRDIVTEAIGHSAGEPALIVYDTHSVIACGLLAAYRLVLPQAVALDFNASTPAQILEVIGNLPPQALVVLVQTSSFRLNDFRIRIELFKLKLKVIEHPHLGRVEADEMETYIDALAYDAAYYRRLGPALKTRIDRATRIRVTSAAGCLSYDSPFEAAKLNIGDYREMKNIGGQFPIGEVFTEPRDLACVNGALTLFAFGDSTFRITVPERPITLVIEHGLLVEAKDAPDAFHRIMDDIRALEETVRVRELGFGLNRAFTRERRVSDTGSYERMCGVHLSLGAKHLMYPRPDFTRKKSRFHVDVFADTHEVMIDDELVFRYDQYMV